MKLHQTYYREPVVKKTLWCFRIDELKTVRLICKNGTCGGVAEVPTERLGQDLASLQCPVCKKDFRSGNQTPHEDLTKLGTAIQSLRGSSLVAVEFVIPAEAE